MKKSSLLSLLIALSLAASLAGPPALAQGPEPDLLLSTSGPLSTSEAGGQDSFTVALTAEPVENVIVAVASSKPAEGSVSPASLTFTPENYADPQPVTVTGVNDDYDDGSQTYQVTLTASGDAGYAGIQRSLSASNSDDDTAGVKYTPVSPAPMVSESGTEASFTVELTSRPTESVTFHAASGNTGEVEVLTPSVSFNNGPTDWKTAKTITLKGVEDNPPVVDGTAIVTIDTTLSSSDPIYAAINPANITAANADNDTALLLVNPLEVLTTNEDQTQAKFTVRLSAQPAANVIVAVASQDTSEGTVSPTSLTFTPGDWSTPQEVTVTGVDDVYDDDNQYYTVTLTASSSGAFNGAQAVVNLLNVDNDTAGVSYNPVDPGGRSVSENGDTLTFSVRLNSRPTAPVTFNVASGNTAEVTVLPSSVTFDAGASDWQTWKNFTLTGVDDTAFDGPKLVLFTTTLTTTDPKYSLVNPADFSITNNDNEAPVQAINDSYNLQEDALLDVAAPGVLANDQVRSGMSAPTVQTWGTPSAGAFEATAADGSFKYRPPKDYHGTVTFNYTARSGSEVSQPATVTITVNAVNDAPLAVADSYVTNAYYINAERNKSLVVPAPGLLANDSDVDHPISELSVVTPVSFSGKGTLIVSPDGGFSYTPALGQADGTVTFTYRVRDGAGLLSNPATVSIIVDTAPPAAPVWASHQEGGTYTIATQTLALRVSPSADTARVEYWRYDHALARWFLDFGAASAAPWQAVVNTIPLPSGLNQVFAVGYDAAGNPSNYADSRIFLLQPLSPRAYLPMTRKAR